jgi:hypothetical protein
LVGAGHPHRRQALEVDIGPVLALPAFEIEPLMEVSLTVEQPHPDHRHREVGGRLERIAGQYAKAAAVQRQ